MAVGAWRRVHGVCMAGAWQVHGHVCTAGGCRASATLRMRLNQDARQHLFLLALDPLDYPTSLFGGVPMQCD